MEVGVAEDEPRGVALEQEQFLVVEALMIKATAVCSAECSTARFAPERIAAAASLGRLSMETAQAIAAAYAACPGHQNNRCHLPHVTKSTL